MPVLNIDPNRMPKVPKAVKSVKKENEVKNMMNEKLSNNAKIKNAFNSIVSDSDKEMLLLILLLEGKKQAGAFAECVLKREKYCAELADKLNKKMVEYVNKKLTKAGKLDLLVESYDDIIFNNAGPEDMPEEYYEGMKLFNDKFANDKKLIEYNKEYLKFINE